jgi:hypothetical protein
MVGVKPAMADAVRAQISIFMEFLPAWLKLKNARSCEWLLNKDGDLWR